MGPRKGEPVLSPRAFLVKMMAAAVVVVVLGNGMETEGRLILINRP